MEDFDAAFAEALKGARVLGMSEPRGRVPHPWVACDYAEEFGCEERAVFGVQEVGVDKPDGGGQACTEHVGELCSTDNWAGSQWRVWTL